MQAIPECYACFLESAVKLVRRSYPDDSAMALEAVRDWSAQMATLSPELSPPAMAGVLYPRLCDLLGDPDPFAEYKEQSNEAALAALPTLWETIQSNPDPMGKALAISIAGNWLDPAAPNHKSFEDAIIDAEQPDQNVVEELKEAFVPDAKVLILGDNAGEIVLDTLLVRLLKEQGCAVTYAVRETPILNDATMHDAKVAGMDALCPVISSGVNTPGTVLEQCTEEFLTHFHGADIVISKGQGNFEALSGNAPGVYCAFKAKCPVVAKQVGSPEGSSILTRL